MNIAVVGLDYDFVENFSKSLALKMKLKFINFNDELEKVLLKTGNAEILNGEAETKETTLIRQIVKQENILLSITNDSFLSNKNYIALQEVFTILIENDNVSEILKNIQKILKKHCKITIKQENIDINEILNIIKG